MQILIMCLRCAKNIQSMSEIIIGPIKLVGGGVNAFLTIILSRSGREKSALKYFPVQ